jgi:uncharacterized protein YbjT (DUF2867 family)
MNILLTGSSGFIGGHIKRRLEEGGHKVVPIDRSHGIDFNQMLEPENWIPHLQGIDVVINSVGIIVERRGQSFAHLHKLAPSALFQACVKTGVKRVIQISALGADEQAFTPYQQNKFAADELLCSLPQEWFVLRPSLVYGEGGASLKMFKQMARFPLLALADGGRQQVQPVHISDLVTTVERCLQEATPGQTIDVVGPYALSFAAWLQLLRTKQGRGNMYILPLPFSLVLTTARLAHHFIPIMHPDNLRMLQHGNTAAVQPLADFLGRTPLSPEEAL